MKPWSKDILYIQLIPKVPLGEAGLLSSLPKPPYVSSCPERFRDQDLEQEILQKLLRYWMLQMLK